VSYNLAANGNYIPSPNNPSLYLQVTTGTGTHNLYPSPDGHTTDFYRPEILQSQEYSCYGVELSGWTFTSAEKYRYSFQDQAKDKEFWGGAVSYKYRVEDPRLGRFFSVDPLAPKYAYNSPYAFSENRVMDSVELEGLERIPSEIVDNMAVGGLMVTNMTNTI
jgi:RHS repeat-associated protein